MYIFYRVKYNVLFETTFLPALIFNYSETFEQNGWDLKIGEINKWCVCFVHLTHCRIAWIDTSNEYEHEYYLCNGHNFKSKKTTRQSLYWAGPWEAKTIVVMVRISYCYNLPMKETLSKHCKIDNFTLIKGLIQKW